MGEDLGVHPTPEQITRHHASDPARDAAALVPGQPARAGAVDLVEHDPTWGVAYDAVAALVRDALGDRVHALQHVGSTSVPDLPAKPVLDVDLTVADPADEQSYVPDLVAVGFVHRIREPWWHEHRLLVRHDVLPRVNLHVFGPGCPEVVRHRMFRDWLREHPEDCERYAAAKRDAAVATNAVGGTGMDYNRVKEPVVHAIYARLFRAHGLLD